MNRRICWWLFLVATCFVVVSQTGCWKSGSENPAASSIQLEPPSPREKLAKSVEFKFVLPSGKPDRASNANISNSVRFDSSASILPLLSDSPVVTFRLNLLNPGNSTEPLMVLEKTVEVASDGSAQASFLSIPARTVVGDVHVEGANLEGYYDFHGAVDLIEDAENVLEVSPKNSNLQPDVIANVVWKIAASPLLFPKVESDLALKIQGSIHDMDLSSISIYDDALNRFINRNINKSENVTFSANTYVLTADSLTALSQMETIDASSTTIVFLNPPSQLLTLKAGDITIGEPTDIASQGIFHKIISVNRSGNSLTIFSTYATLEEAIVNCSIEHYDTVNRMPAASFRTKRAFIGEFGASLAFKDSFPLGDGISLDYDATLNPKVLVKLEMANSQIKEFATSFDLKGKGKVLLSAMASGLLDFKGETEPRWLKTVFLPVGPVWVPVLIYGSMVLSAKGEGKTGLQIGFEQALDAGVSIRRIDGEWSHDKHFEPRFTPIIKTPLEIGMKFAVGPKISAKIAGLAGPWVLLQGTARLEAAPNLKLFAGIDGALGAKLEVSKLKLEAEYPFQVLEKLIWEKRLNSPPR